MKKPPKLRLSGAMKGRLQGAVRKGRRETVYKMLARQHDGVVPCFCCGRHVTDEEATLEHIVEKAAGGTDEMENLSISHEPCNQERSNPHMAVDYGAVSDQLKAAGIDVTAEFCTLTNGQRLVLVELIRVQKYRKPANADGKAVRCYFDALWRQFNRERK